MAITQVSKIQMRRGMEIDLPGAPTTLSPLAFEAGLAVGEIGFALDSGRLFIGHSPSNGQPNDNRIAFPYQNIEILTEFSPALTRSVGRNSRDVDASAFYSATLAANTTTLADVLVDQLPSPRVLRMNGEKNMGVIEYFAFGQDNRPLRQGTLRFLTEAGADAALIVDYSIWSPALTAATNPSEDPEVMQQNIAFSFVRAGGVSDVHYRLQYTNLLSQPARLFFNVQRPLP